MIEQKIIWLTAYEISDYNENGWEVIQVINTDDSGYNTLYYCLLTKRY